MKNHKRRMTNQPVWKLLANLGDVNPVDHGGLFVYQDLTGVYPEECEKLVSPADPIERARAYESIGDYHGFDNLDSYPLIFSNRSDVTARYTEKNK